MDDPLDGAGHRKHVRVLKSFSMFFYVKDLPDRKKFGALIKDIGKGGLCFTNVFSMKEGVHLVFEIPIPWLASKKIFLEGLVVRSREITKFLVYEIRAKFISMDENAVEFLDRIEKVKLKG